jgi:hypothetical protein
MPAVGWLGAAQLGKAVAAAPAADAGEPSRPLSPQEQACQPAKILMKITRI